MAPSAFKVALPGLAMPGLQRKWRGRSPAVSVCKVPGPTSLGPENPALGFGAGPGLGDTGLFLG